jgi:hypothetical protein
MERLEAEEIARKIQLAQDGVITGSKLKWATLEIQVHRAATDTIENYGIVSGYHKNPIKHYWMQLGIWLRGIKRTWLQYWQTEAKK